MTAGWRTWRIARSSFVVLLLAAACSSHSSLDPNDPFGDPFFYEGFGSSSSLDEILYQPAPSVGWLAADIEEGGEERFLAEQEGKFSMAEGDPSAEEDLPPRREKSFSEKAQEATMATMSILVGAGMAALPYLIGAF